MFKLFRGLVFDENLVPLLGASALPRRVKQTTALLDALYV